MKTIASEIKVGQTIKHGNSWATVLAEPVPAKIGKNLLIKVQTIATTIRRKDGVKQKLESNECFFSFRPTTMVDTK